MTFFALGADGDVAPARKIEGENTGLDSIAGITSFPDGSVAVTDSSTGVISVFAAGADGDVEPIRSFVIGEFSDSPRAIAAMANGNLAVTGSSGAIYEFASDAAGEATPLRTIQGTNTGVVALTGLAELSSGELAALNIFDPPSVRIFAADADGDVSPVRTIEGASTGLLVPQGLTELSDGSIAVANAGRNVGITVYPGPPPPPAVFVAVEPYRAYDSREGDGPLVPGESVLVETGVPFGAVAVAYNLTATGMTGSGLLAVSPGDAPAGGTSTLNFTAPRQTWANASTSGVDDAGQIMVMAAGASTQVIVDVVGYYSVLAPPTSAAAAGVGVESLFVPINPTRAYDSRDIGAGGPLAGQQSRMVNVTAGGEVPPEATAVAYTLTQTGTTGTGFLTVGPAGFAQPDVSSINWYTANQTSANSSVVGITDGAVKVWAGSSSGGSAQFVIDVLGYYLTAEEFPWAGAFTPIDPQRAYDSRVDEPAGPISGGQGFTTSMAVAEVPEDAVAVTYNLTATGTSGSGFLTTVPGDVPSPPVASTINWWQSGQTLANGSVVDVPDFERLVQAKGDGVNGTLGLPVTTFAGGGSAQYIIDVSGYFTFRLS